MSNIATLSEMFSTFELLHRFTPDEDNQREGERRDEDLLAYRAQVKM